MKKSNGKERLLEAARSLMLEKGFNATSLDEVCEKAHITKGALFYHFKDKEALGKAAVEYHVEIGAKMLAEAPFLQLEDPLDRLIGYIEFIVGITRDPIKEGCLLGTFSQELGSSQTAILDACNEGFTNWREAIVVMLEQASIRHKPQNKIDARGLAQQFLATYEGSIILAKATRDCSIIKNTVQHYIQYLLMLFTPSTKVHP